jgi:RHS repeat-associated protein
MKSIVHGPALDELILQDVNPFEDLIHGIPVVGPTLSNATGNITLVSLGGVLGDPASTRVWFIQDSQNSVIAITNSTGFVLEGYEYHPYGDPVIYAPGPNGVVEWGADDIIAATSSYSVVNLYTGREWDHESGLYHYRSRYMSPVMGRFISSDTIGVWVDTNSLGNGYTYCSNIPTNCVDHFGEFSCKKCKKLAKDLSKHVAEKSRAIRTIIKEVPGMGVLTAVVTEFVADLADGRLFNDPCGYAGAVVGGAVDEVTPVPGFGGIAGAFFGEIAEQGCRISTGRQCGFDVQKAIEAVIVAGLLDYLLDDGDGGAAVRGRQLLDEVIQALFGKSLEDLIPGSWMVGCNT